jgi:predicted ArsR family transcriptional regulator
MTDRDRNDSGQFADGIEPDTVLDVFDARDDLARPITAGDVVDELGIARRTAHNKLGNLVERGTLKTRKIGARGRVYWRPIPADTADTQPATNRRESGETESKEQADESDVASETSLTTPENADTAADDDLADAVDRVAAGWEDTDARIEARKEAALAVLEYAREHGSVSKRKAKEQIEPDYSVSDQKPRTWYRKNVRPVLNEVAEYDQSERGYRLTVD